MGWKQNDTLDGALMHAARESGASFRQRMLLRLCLLMPRKREELELALTEKAVAAGIIPPSGDQIVAGCYVGDWGDGTFLNWLIANWPAILEMIMQIIALFASVLPLLLAGGIFAQCSGGVCTPPAAKPPVRSVLTKVTHVEQSGVKRVRARQPVRRALGRVVFWR